MLNKGRGFYLKHQAPMIFFHCTNNHIGILTEKHRIMLIDQDREETKC